MPDLVRNLDDADLTLDEMFRRWPGTATVFLKHKMLCVGCPVAHFHKVTDACEAYDLEFSEFYALLAEQVTAP